VSGGHRRSTRLPDYDYASAGAYFVTICAYGRQLLFDNPSLVAIAEDEWRALASRFANVKLDAFVVMPNHIHFVLWLDPVGAPLAGALAGAEPVGAPLAGAQGDSRAGASPAPTLGTIVGAFKSRVATRWLIWLRANAPETPGRIWQRNYYERVIRDEAELTRVRAYILNNPLQWHLDRENPERTPDSAYDREWGWLEAT